MYIKNRLQELAGIEAKKDSAKEEKKQLLENIREISESGKYPPTASEYAQELNEKNPGFFKLVEDQAFWEQSNVYTGEDLARYLAVQGHSDAFKEKHGVRPRHIEYNQYSIEEIEKMTDELYDNSR